MSAKFVLFPPSELTMRNIAKVCTFLVTIGFVGMIQPAITADKPKAAGTTNKAPTKPKKQPPFRWVNPLPKGTTYPGVQHRTFLSPSMQIDVGYCIYLPPEYSAKENKDRRFPVVYYLHGGRPGSEIKSVSLSTYIDDAIKQGKIPPAIYVFVNGGEVSLTEKLNHDCVFYDRKQGCTVYEDRPRQCRTWPFWGSVVHSPETWAETAETCPGMDVGRLHRRAEIDRSLRDDGTSTSPRARRTSVAS